ncbi:hypothetical protein DPEC_G00137870 [Dallia pectoralis]|uniref:Uncharacterized protein n=1 Tax=Dallia pectoralis TaxID=75939 RepID=A0ACC2GLQ3_DALPE|nr:hypothetical protein DPEC_G00137870 [Dallia pectoralis]
MYHLKCVLSSWVSIQVIITQVWSQGVSPPLDVRVDSVVHWSRATDRPDLTYTVQSKTNDGKWQDIDGCVQTKNTTCKKDIRGGCVMVRVWAQQGNKTSEAIEACRHATSCSPVVQLTAQSGLLLVNWRKDESLSAEYGSILQYHVNYSREGEELQYDSISEHPVTLQGLEVGGRYCVQVQYQCYHKPFGTHSRLQCVSIPESERAKHIRTTLISVLIPVFLGAVAIFLIFLFYKHLEKLKQLRPRALQLPEHYEEFFFQDFSQQLFFTNSYSDEHYDTVSSVLDEDDQVDSGPYGTRPQLV